MDSIEKVLERIRIARKEKGYSHEIMAEELGLSQSAYSNIENNRAGLTIERFLQISEVLQKPTHFFFDSSPQTIYNQENKDNATGNYIGHFENLYQDNVELIKNIQDTFNQSVDSFKKEISFLQEQINAKDLLVQKLLEKMQ